VQRHAQTAGFRLKTYLEAKVVTCQLHEMPGKRKTSNTQLPLLTHSFKIFCTPATSKLLKEIFPMQD